MHVRRGIALRRIFAAVSILIGAAVSTEAGSYSWTTSGPQPGYIFQIVANSQDSNRLIVTAGFSGPMVFQSSDRGSSWIEQPALLFSGRLTPHPTNGNVVYTIGYSGGASGVLKSVDGGTTWSSAGAGLPASPTISALALSPSDPETLYAIVGGGPGQVYRSTDGAASWALVSSAFPSFYVNDVKVDPQNSAIVYATSYNLDVIKSVDGGATWLATGLGLDTIRIVIDPANPLRVFAGTSGSGVYRSDDGGATWGPANGGIEAGSVRDLALDPFDPDTLWVGTAGTEVTGGLFKTTNAQDWSRVDLGEPVAIGTAIAFDPHDSSRIYAAASLSVVRGEFFQSDDRGVTWTRTEKGLSGYYANAVAAHPTSSEVAYGVSGAKAFRTDSAGADWVLRDDTGSALTCLALDPTGADTLYAGYVFSDFTGDGVLKSVDGGLSWNPTTGALAVQDLRRLAISPSAPDHLLAASYDGLFETQDGGDSWTPTPLLAGDMRAAAFDPADPLILYAGLFSDSQTGFGLFRSPDGGVTWSPPDGIPVEFFRATDIAAPANDPSRVYVTALSGVFRSLDRGLSFAPAVDGLPPMPGIQPLRLAVDPSRVGTLYMLAGLGGGAATDAPEQAPPPNVFRTTSGADSWTPLPGFLPLLGSLELSVSSSGRTLYAATISGIFQFERSYPDVPDADPFWSSVDAAAMNAVTAGCGGGKFCPDDPTLRSTVAVFLLRAKNGVSYAPPPATGTIFGDVPADAAAAPYIEELAREGVTAGCGGGDYCPGAPVRRSEAAVLLLKAEHGGDYAPPPATGLVFSDVPADAFAADWIEQFALEGLTAGCGGGKFCPDAPVSRAQAAAFVVLTFGLS